MAPVYWYGVALGRRVVLLILYTVFNAYGIDDFKILGSVLLWQSVKLTIAL